MSNRFEVLAAFVEDSRYCREDEKTDHCTVVLGRFKMGEVMGLEEVGGRAWDVGITRKDNIYCPSLIAFEKVEVSLPPGTAGVLPLFFSDLLSFPM
eukprot:g40681.t1